MTRPVKHSLTLGGHRTSVSLEAEFWAGLKEAAEAKGLGINALASEVDAGRAMDSNLASALRLYVLRYYRDRQS